MSNTRNENSRYWRPDDSDEKIESKLLSKIREDPSVPIGFVGLIGALGYGAYSYKNRGPAMTTSRYLMRLRVVAQFMVVGAMITGVGVRLYNRNTATNNK